MADIVERMRDYARNCGGPPEEYLTWQVADEIERLRVENEELKTMLRRMVSRDTGFDEARRILEDKL